MILVAGKQRIVSREGHKSVLGGLETVVGQVLGAPVPPPPPRTLGRAGRWVLDARGRQQVGAHHARPAVSAPPPPPTTTRGPGLLGRRRLPLHGRVSPRPAPPPLAPARASLLGDHRRQPGRAGAGSPPAGRKETAVSARPAPPAGPLSGQGAGGAGRGARRTEPPCTPACLAASAAAAPGPAPCRAQTGIPRIAGNRKTGAGNFRAV